MTCRLALLPLAIGALLAGKAAATGPVSMQVPLVRAAMQTDSTSGGGSDSAAFVVGAPSRPGILGSAALGGLERYDASGKRQSSTPAGEAVAVDAIADQASEGQAAMLVASIDGTDNSLRLYRMDASGLHAANARALPLGFAGEGVCLGRNPIDVKRRCSHSGEGPFLTARTRRSAKPGHSAGSSIVAAAGAANAPLIGIGASL